MALKELHPEPIEIIVDLNAPREEVSSQDIDNVLALLERFGSSEEGRMRLKVEGNQPGGTAAKVHHHGRCDVGSAWACGTVKNELE